MPNHFENDLYIDGPKEKVSELLAFIGADKTEPEFDFSAVIPYPQEYAQRDLDARNMNADEFEAKYGSHHDGFNSGGYEWRIENWGTRWGAYDVQRRDRKGPCISFQTAWSPSIPIIAALHKRFPEVCLSLEYFECRGAFSGGVTYERAEYAEDYDDWAPGVPVHKWHNDDYLGRRGG